MRDSVRLGSSELVVSPLALGSWRTFEHLSKDEGLAVMAAARRLGVTFLDDARYDDETGHAPLATGYSEVLFGELFRAAEWPRGETVVTNKLWWEFWPEESAAAELDGSLERMGFDYIDVIYANPPPSGLGVPGLVDEVIGLVESGKARSWAIVNWPATQFAEVIDVAAARGAAGPCAVQLPYSPLQRAIVEDPAMIEAIDRAGASLIPSAVLAGGLLSGKYRDAGAPGRLRKSLSNAMNPYTLGVIEELRSLADDLDVAPASLAVAFAAAHPRTASTLVGATRPDQLEQSAAGVELARSLEPDDLARLRAVGRRTD
jgi:aryl-alcohol dehydrogenase-like predicted oxidoreductase